MGSQASSGGRGPCLGALLALCLAGLAACGSGKDAEGLVKGAGAPVALVREAGAGSSLAAVATSKLPPFELRLLAPGSASFASRLGPVLAQLTAQPSIRAVVIMPAPAGTAAAIEKARSTGKPGLWIVAKTGDDPLALEAVADLAVDFALADGSAAPVNLAVDPALEAALATGLCELARRAATGKARVDDRDEIRAALRSAGGWDWKVEYRRDPATKIKAKNHVLATATARR